MSIVLDAPLVLGALITTVTAVAGVQQWFKASLVQPLEQQVERLAQSVRALELSVTELRVTLVGIDGQNGIKSEIRRQVEHLAELSERVDSMTTTLMPPSNDRNN